MSGWNLHLATGLQQGEYGAVCLRGGFGRVAEDGPGVFGEAARGSCEMVVVGQRARQGGGSLAADMPELVLLENHVHDAVADGSAIYQLP